VDPIEIEIIPQLHRLGSEVRQMQHVYEGYKNLVLRLLEPSKKATHGANPMLPHSSTMEVARMNGHQGPFLASSAVSRFERLGDRLELLILSETKELLAAKEALGGTVWSSSPHLQYYLLTFVSSSISTRKRTRRPQHVLLAQLGYSRSFLCSSCPSVL
jgi:hypothetical protein